MSEFKDGDKVYFPKKSTKILKIEVDNSLDTFPITVANTSLTTDGKLPTDLTPSIFHATDENRELLGRLYGIEFDPPEPTSKDIILAMLERGDKYVPCWVSTTNERPDSEYPAEFVLAYEDSSCLYNCKNGSWKFATPFNPRTETAITELPK